MHTAAITNTTPPGYRGSHIPGGKEACTLYRNTLADDARGDITAKGGRSTRNQLLRVSRSTAIKTPQAYPT